MEGKSWYEHSMFVKLTKSKNFTYLQLVESYRENGKVKHRVIANLGRLDILEKNKKNVVKIIKKILKLIQAEELVIEKDNIKEVERLNWGYVIYEKLWKKFGLDEEMDRLTTNRKIKFNFKLSVFLMVLDRLLFQHSKKGVAENQRKFWNLEQEINLTHLYRSLDILSELKEEIEETLYFKGRDLFNQELDVVYYDVTTFSFESVRSDGLREFGYSKDGKHKEVQVVMGLLIDKEGRPVGYELYSGNTFEGKTLVDSLKKLKERFSIKRVIIVADRGLNNRLNLHLIKEAGYDYIVSMRLKSLPVKLQEEILKEEGYEEIKEGELKIKELPHESVQKIVNEKGEVEEKRHKDRLICSWSQSRADKDRADRERLLKKAEKIIKKGSSLTRKVGAKKFIRTEGKEKILGIDEERILEDSKYDGYYVIQTSDFKLSGSEIYEAYHGLWKIEESFRVLKSTMRTRPIFHWTEKRIRGHFVMCFLAFLLERELELKLKQKGIKASPEKIKEAINSLELSKLQIGDEHYYLKGKAQPLANKILNALRIKHLSNFFQAKDSK